MRLVLIKELGEQFVVLEGAILTFLRDNEFRLASLTHEVF